jgi:sulfur carrier protein ThiS
LTITVQVQLFSRFRSLLPAEARGRATVELPQGATVARLLEDLDVAGNEHGRVRRVAVNGQSRPDHDYILHDGDQVRIFPFVVGG